MPLVLKRNLPEPVNKIGRGVPVMGKAKPRVEKVEPVVEPITEPTPEPVEQPKQVRKPKKNKKGRR